MAELSCAACGRKFVFKPEYAGKTLKCKCGQPIKAPAAVPAGAPAAAKPAQVAAKQPVSARQPVAAAAAPKPAAASVASGGGGDDDFNKLFSDAEAEYEMAPPLTTGPKEKPPVAKLAPAGAGGGGGASSAMLAYGRASSRGAVPAKTDADKAAAVSDLYIPIALIIVGLVLYMFSAHQRGASSAVEACLYVIISCGLNLILVFTALMIAVKAIGLGLGAIGPALLKIAAVAVLPSAVGDLLYWFSGISLVSVLVTLFMYYGFLMWLFDMDAGEVRIVAGIMIAIRWILNIFIVGALLTGVGFSGTTLGGRPTARSARSSMLTGNQSADDVTDDAKMSPGELDKWCETEINTNAAYEAHDWLNPKNTHNQGLGWSQREIRELADKFVIAGAKKTWCAAIEKGEEGDILCTRLIVELPDDPGKRAACFDVRDFAEKRDDPSKDTGGKYLTVMIHVMKAHGGM